MSVLCGRLQPAAVVLLVVCSPEAVRTRDGGLGADPGNTPRLASDSPRANPQPPEMGESILVVAAALAPFASDEAALMTVLDYVALLETDLRTTALDLAAIDRGYARVGLAWP
jgi:hypothetical protein